MSLAALSLTSGCLQTYQPYVLRTIRVKTQQIILPDAPKVYELPTRKWRMQLFILDEEGNEQPATLFDYVTYHLHPTFERPLRKLTEPPFTLDEQGWGEFELKIIAKVKFCSTTYTFHHELSFDNNAYNVDYEGRFPYHQTKLREELLNSGSVPIYNEDEISLGQVTNLQRAINLISVSDVDTIQKVINTIVTFPPVSEEIAKRRHQEDDIVILLSQIPNQLLNKICRLVEASSAAS